MVDVFISYPRAARTRAESIKSKLEALGLEVFFDVDSIDGGAEFPTAIRDAVDSAKSVLGCWSALAFSRPWVMEECRLAKRREVLVPIAIERLDPSTIPAEFSDLHYLDLSDWGESNTHEGWGRTLQALGKLIGRELAPPPRRSKKMSLEECIVGILTAVASADGQVTDAERAWWRQMRLSHPLFASLSSDEFSALMSTTRDKLTMVGWGDAISFWGSDVPPGKAEMVYSMAVELQHVDGVDPREREIMSHVAESLSISPERAAQIVQHHAQSGRAADTGVEIRRQEKETDHLEVAVVAARDAAIAGREIVQRTFPIELADVVGWPRPEMVVLPPGIFMMGSPESELKNLPGLTSLERPQHQVRIDRAFALGKFPVTFAEWDAAVASGADLKRPADEGWGRGRRPVINVSWEDAKAYIAWLNGKFGLKGRTYAYRLPSEAEWEYGCRAGTTSSFNFGDTISKDKVQFSEKKPASAGWTLPVDTFSANAFGLLDMHGNTQDWCEDAWHYDYQGAPDDGSAWCVDGDCPPGYKSVPRVLRGGSWYSDWERCRSAARQFSSDDSGGALSGFRLARTVSPLA